MRKCCHFDISIGRQVFSVSLLKYRDTLYYSVTRKGHQKFRVTARVYAHKSCITSHLCYRWLWLRGCTAAAWVIHVTHILKAALRRYKYRPHVSQYDYHRQYSIYQMIDDVIYYSARFQHVLLLL